MTRIPSKIFNLEEKGKWQEYPHYSCNASNKDGGCQGGIGLYLQWGQESSSIGYKNNSIIKFFIFFLSL